jgi:hypothetical protein
VSCWGWIRRREGRRSSFGSIFRCRRCALGRVFSRRRRRAFLSSLAPPFLSLSSLPFPPLTFSCSPLHRTDPFFVYSNEDDLTVKLTEIVFMNAVIKTGLAKGVTTQNLMVRLLHFSTFFLPLSPFRKRQRISSLQKRCDAHLALSRRNNGSSYNSPSQPTSTRSFPESLPSPFVSLPSRPFLLYSPSLNRRVKNRCEVSASA